jgi:pimeloyl-ACP methyl ester carboxylesterase
VKKFFEDVRVRERWRVEQREKRKGFVHNVVVGDIYRTSWGYDQTNVEFFQAIEVKGKYCILREIESASVLDAIRIEKAHFPGYSMGGWIGFHLGIDYPERFLSMIIGGAHPYFEDLTALRDIANAGGPNILSFWDALGAPLSNSVKDHLVRFPELPLHAIVRDDLPDLSRSLGRLTMPTLIYAGDQDFRYAGVRGCVSDLPNARWISIPGLDHLAAMVRSDAVLPHVMEFLEDVSNLSQ